MHVGMTAAKDLSDRYKGHGGPPGAAAGQDYVQWDALMSVGYIDFSTISTCGAGSCLRLLGGNQSEVSQKGIIEEYEFSGRLFMLPDLIVALLAELIIP